MISSLASVHWPHYTASMTDVTDLLEAIQNGQPQAAEALLPLVYDELRRLARQKLRHEQPGHTLEATALVHEAYLRLVGGGEQGMGDEGQQWDHRGHFFAAAAEAMRRILVESARRKKRLKRGGDLDHEPLDEQSIRAPAIDADLL